MSWNEADRAKYDVIRARYSSDMSEAEFALIAPLLPPAKRRGRKLTDPQAILNALFYMIRRACPWRYLPKDSAVHDRAEQILREARWRVVDANRRDAHDGGARGAGPRSGANRRGGR